MGDPGKLRTLWEKGARMMTLCWNYENELAYPAVSEPGAGGTIAPSVPDGAAGGLKEQGIELLEEMEALGMIPDVSHLSDAGVRDVLANTRKPFVASHSNARALCGHGRNLTDELLRELGERGCVIGLNYYRLFLYPEQGGPGTLDADGAAARKYWRESCERTSEAAARHAVYMADRAGIESLGLGSDFDGFPAQPDLAGASDIENLLWALHRQGFSDGEIERISEGNVLRLYSEVLRKL